MVASIDIELKERTFSVVQDSKEENFKIIRPTFLIGNKADLIYKKGFSDALMAGLITTFQMKEKLDGMDYYSKSNDELDKIDAEILTKEEELSALDNEVDATPVILKLKELRARRLLEVFKMNAMYENTAESYAEGLRNQFYASQLTLDNGGIKVWETFKDFQEDARSALASSAVNQVMLFNAHVKNNFEMDFAENQWMLKHEIIDEDGNYIKKEEPAAEENAGEQNVTEPAKKKKARKRNKKAEQPDTEN